MIDALLTTSIPEGELVSRGKVRDIYAHDDALVLVRVSRAKEEKLLLVNTAITQ
jgi:hypothetical protein